MNYDDDMQPEPWVLPHMLPRGCDMQGRYETRQWPDTIPTGYGDDMKYPKPMPRVVPCSTLARLWLAWRRFWLG